MPDEFVNVRFHAGEKEDEELRTIGTRPVAFRGLGRPRSLIDNEVTFNNDEMAARHYLRGIFENDTRATVRGLAAPNRPEVVPDLRFLGAQSVPLTQTNLVRFVQTQSSIPIFGSRVIVELDENRELVSMDAEVAGVKGVSPVASLSPVQALESIVKLTGANRDSFKDIQPPELNFYHDPNDDLWHLAYYFRKVPAAPSEFLKSTSTRRSQGHGLGASPRVRFPQLDYLVDAHDGKVLFYCSAVPLLVVPTKLRGVDELGIPREFWGVISQAGHDYQMSDPIRAIKTYDLGLNDLETSSLPSDPVHQAAYDFGTASAAAVSAHFNATQVFDFYKAVLLRDGIDDKGMDLVSAVNCTFPSEEHPPEWHNAIWWNNRMSYGQMKDSGGKLHSFAKYLDVIAHELTHGVTEFTSKLIYQGQSGALNESFSDIFGVIINNWFTVGANSDPRKWNWQIGAGLGMGGQPLRDMSNPKATGDPDHMKDFWNTRDDSGGVHTNSNIHNKAAYNVLTAVDATGQLVFSPRDVAVLYYLCLTRLNSIATFSKALQTLVDVATTYYPDLKEREKKIDAIRSAYRAVGIS